MSGLFKQSKNNRGGNRRADANATKNTARKMASLPGRKRRASSWQTPGIVALLIVIFSIASVTGLYLLFGQLADIYNEQCCVGSMDDDVEIITGKMVHPDIVTMRFGLTNGANLAEIDFAKKREELLEQIPGIRAVMIERRMPCHVTVEITEREPIARLTSGGRVVDEEGVVFNFARRISGLPIIRDPEDDTVPGRKLSGHTSTALRLLSALRLETKELDQLKILEVDATRPDYLLLTLADYSQVKFAWERMDEDSHASQRAMLAQLRNLNTAIASRLGDGARLWTATVPGRVFANDPDTPVR